MSVVHSEPAVRPRATPAGSPPGLACRFTRSPLHALSRRRNTRDGRPGVGHHDHLRLARPAERQAHRAAVRGRSAAARRRKRLVLVAPYLCYMRQDTAFHEGEAISQKVIGPLLRRDASTASSPSMPIFIARRDIRAVFPGIEADNLSAMPAICRRAAQDRARPRNSRGRARCGIAPLGQRSRRPARPRPIRLRRKPAAAIARSRSSLPGPGLHRRPPGPAGRRHRLVRRHHDRLRQGARAPPARRRSTPSSPMPCFRLTVARRSLTAAGIRSIRSTTACRTPPMRLRSMTSVRRRLAAARSMAKYPETPP